MNKKLLCLLLLAQSAATVGFAQDAAALKVTVFDPSGAVVPEAEITLTDTLHGNVMKVKSQADGSAVFEPLTPSDYNLEAIKTGFNQFRLTNLTVSLRDRRAIRVDLQVTNAKATEVKVIERTEAPSSDAGLGVTLENSYLEHLPANGRNVESLLLMTPGITTAAGGKGGGGVNANGLRSNMNYFTLDGVSMNNPVAGGGPGGGGGRFGGPGGGDGPFSAGAGGATEMISIDAMQEMRVQTSAYAPEFGRSPGAQVTMTSRGGTNAYHGTVFYYLRNDKFDANDWFANAGGYGKGKERQNRPGVTFGGPLVKNKTFFFLSIEDLKLTAPYSVIAVVPDLASRRTVAAALRPYLNAFPLPNGANLASGGAQYRTVISNPNRSDAVSLRLDHALTSRMNLFLRYNFNPSSSTRRGSDAATPNLLTHQSTHAETLTGGLSRTFAGGMINDIRINYSDSNNHGNTVMDTFGGAVPLADATVFPKGVTSANASFSFNILGFAGYNYGGHSANEQKQVNVVDTLTKISGKHSFKIGVDVRRIMQTTHHNPYSIGVSFDGVTSSSSYSIQTGTALNGIISSSLDTVYPTFLNASAYVQDTWRVTERTTLTYGLRYDVNPAPTARSGPKPFALSDSTIAGVTQNDPMYPTQWKNFAPRIGIAYLSDDRPGHEMTFRAGVGLFYDSGYGISSGAFNGAPYTDVHTVSPVKFPFTAALLAPPALPPTRPYGEITAGDTTLSSPMIYQYSATWEKFYGAGQMVSLSYIGTMGRDLLRTQSTGYFSTAYDVLRVASNGATSDYKGFQLQYRKRFSGNLNTQFSYTLGRATDSASNDAGFGGFATLFGAGDKGASDYDIRHNVNFSGSYRLPGPKKGIAGNTIGGWFIDWVASGRSALPFDLSAVSTTTSATSSSSVTPTSATAGDTSKGLFAQVRPSTNGLPIWISDKTAPGGKRLNPLAFYIPTGYQQGNMSRNSLRGFPMYQVDLAFRKTIHFTDRFNLSLAAQGYNILNHANFSNPSPFEGGNLSSPSFGLATRMVNQGFGGGLNQLYRSGGPRSMELSIRLQF